MRKIIIYLIEIQFLILFLSYESFAQSDNIKISSDFPGGNIKIDRIAKDTVWLRPDLRDIDPKKYWFYWYFKIEGMSGSTIHFQFPKKPVFARFGPAYSLNNDSTWKWYGIASYKNHGFDFTFSEKDTSAYFSIAFPYTQKNLHEFLGTVRNGNLLRLDTLTFSRKGRAVEELHIKPSKSVKYKVLLTARNHACEMTTDYVLEGIMESILNEKGLKYLRENVEFCIIPFVDKDGVEDGNQGKWEVPRDHNRDYDSNAIYPEIQAIMAKTKEWSNDKLKVVMDIHCPYIRGHNDAEYICLVGTKDTDNANQQILMSKIIEDNNKGELRFLSSNFMEYGTAWNTAANYTQGVSCAGWGTTIPGVRLSTTLEFPYANVSGIMVSKDNARTFGKSIAYSIQNYLKTLKR